MLKLLVVLGIGLACVPTSAQTLQKCIGKGGAVAFRSGPCEAGERLVELREGASDVRSPEQWKALRERQRREAEAQANLRRSNSGQVFYVENGRSGARNAKVVRCERAKKRRDDDIASYRGKARLERHSYWNHVVYEACKP